MAHNWFAAVVEGTELGSVYSIQLKQLIYEDYEDKGTMEATMAVMKDF